MLFRLGGYKHPKEHCHNYYGSNPDSLLQWSKGCLHLLVLTTSPLAKGADCLLSWQTPFAYGPSRLALLFPLESRSGLSVTVKARRFMTDLSGVGVSHYRTRFVSLFFTSRTHQMVTMPPPQGISTPYHGEQIRLRILISPRKTTESPATAALNATQCAQRIPYGFRSRSSRGCTNG